LPEWIPETALKHAVLPPMKSDKEIRNQAVASQHVNVGVYRAPSFAPVAIPAIPRDDNNPLAYQNQLPVIRQPSLHDINHTVVAQFFVPARPINPLPPPASSAAALSSSFPSLPAAKAAKVVKAAKFAKCAIAKVVKGDVAKVAVPSVLLQSVVPEAKANLPVNVIELSPMDMTNYQVQPIVQLPAAEPPAPIVAKSALAQIAIPPAMENPAMPGKDTLPNTTVIGGYHLRGRSNSAAKSKDDQYHHY
jgi:hypothetical protein